MNRYWTVLLAMSGIAYSATWRPIDPAQLALKAPAVEKDADAEILLWDVRVEDKVTGQDAQVTLVHYLRLKVFTDKGAKDLSSIDIPLFGKRAVVDLSARTITPDGQITEMK